MICDSSTGSNYDGIKTIHSREFTPATIYWTYPQYLVDVSSGFPKINNWWIRQQSGWNILKSIPVSKARAHVLHVCKFWLKLFEKGIKTWFSSLMFVCISVNNFKKRNKPYINTWGALEFGISKCNNVRSAWQCNTDKVNVNVILNINAQIVCIPHF